MDKVPSEEELPVKLCNYTDVYYNERICASMGLMETTATLEEIRRFGLNANDVLITKDSEEWNDIAVPSLVVETAPDLVCGYHLGIIRSASRKLLARFLLRALQSRVVNQQFQVAATGVTRYGLPKSSIGEALIPNPPISEQIAIADFLDRKTASIDTLIAEKRALIEKLKEKRSAFISRTVTQGMTHIANVDRPAALKRSGVECLGKIPDHWQVRKLGHLAQRVGSGKTPRGGAETYLSEGVLLIRSQNVHNTGLKLEDAVFIDDSTDADMAGTRVREGDVLLNITGASLGRCTFAPRDLGRANVNQHVCIIRLHPKRALAAFISHALSSQPVQSQIFAFESGSSREGLNFHQVRQLLFALPPLSEQHAIADFLDRETTKINALIAKIEQVSKLLQEYRAALITAAVTGKIDVRQEKSGRGGQSGLDGQGVPGEPRVLHGQKSGPGGQRGRGDKILSRPARTGVHA